MTRRLSILFVLFVAAVVASAAPSAMPTLAAPTPSAPTPRVAPSSPRDVRAEAGDKRVTLSWRAPAAGASPTGYRIQRRNGAAWVTVRDLPASARRTVVRGFTNGQIARLRIAALSADGRGAFATASVVLPITLQITAGRLHTCALRADRTVVCFGYNGFGQLGDGSTTDRRTPVRVRTSSGAVLRNVRSIDAGGNSTCAVTTSGEAWCWGDNDNGNLGDGSTTDRPLATQMRTPSGQPLGGVRGVSVGAYHTCVWMADATARCTGDNREGQLGRGMASTTDAVQPRPVLSSGQPLQGVREIRVGDFHTCARLSSGSVVCVGGNSFGQLGVGDTDDRLQPTPVFDGANSSNVSGARQIDLGENVTCVRLTSGTTRCTGYNTSGALVNSTNDNGVVAGLPLAPSDSGLSTPAGVAAIATSGHHTCVVFTSGAVSCGGDNAHGEVFSLDQTNTTILGTAFRSAGVPLRGVVSVALGYDHSCVRLGDGSVRCVGDNRTGQLGTGTPGPTELVPVRPTGL